MPGGATETASQLTPVFDVTENRGRASEKSASLGPKII